MIESDNRLVVHVGCHKTGTTTIQHFLNQTPIDGLKVLDCQDDIAMVCKYSLLGTQLCNRVKKKLKKVSKDYRKTVVISSEELSGTPQYFYSDAPEVARNLHFLVSKYFTSVKIIVYIRKQSDWVESIYKQQIHQGESYSFRDFINQIPCSVLDWRILISAYEKHFGKGNVVIKLYDKEILSERGGLIADFMQSVCPHLDSSFVDTSDQLENVSYSLEALEFARKVNPALNAIERQYLRRILQAIDSRAPRSSYSFLSDDDRLKFDQQHNEINREICSLYFPSREKLFSTTTVSGEEKKEQKISINDDVFWQLIMKIYFSDNYRNLYSLKVLSAIEKRIKKLVGSIPLLGKLIRSWVLRYLN